MFKEAFCTALVGLFTILALIITMIFIDENMYEYCSKVLDKYKINAYKTYESYDLQTLKRKDQ